MVRNSDEIERGIVLFDGECIFCNSTVHKIIKYDKKDRLRFASQQSEIGQKIMNDYGYYDNEFNTIVFIREKKVFTKSDAVVEISRLLVGFPRILITLQIIPRDIRNFLYSFFSKYRYNLFGKKDQCNIPTQENKNKFIV